MEVQESEVLCVRLHCLIRSGQPKLLPRFRTQTFLVGVGMENGMGTNTNTGSNRKVRSAFDAVGSKLESNLRSSVNMGVLDVRWNRVARNLIASYKKQRYLSSNQKSLARYILTLVPADAPDPVEIGLDWQILQSLGIADELALRNPL